jgi:hypothetical protein
MGGWRQLYNVAADTSKLAGNLLLGLARRTQFVRAS